MSKCLVVTVSLLQFDLKEAVKVLICCGCLGDRSDDANEIVECDGCGVTVHEGKKFSNHVLHVLSQVLPLYLKKFMYLDVLVFLRLLRSI